MNNWESLKCAIFIMLFMFAITWGLSAIIGGFILFACFYPFTAIALILVYIFLLCPIACGVIAFFDSKYRMR